MAFKKKRRPFAGRLFKSHEGGRDRTFDHLLKRQMLYH